MSQFASLSGFEILRIMCGAFLIPHAIGKITAREASFGFFRSAGFRRPAPYVYTALTFEIIAGILLLVGILPHPVALITSLYLLVATAAVAKVSRRWLWHIGGCEFPLFWALCCFLVWRFG